MARVLLDYVTKRFGDFVAVDKLQLEIRDKEFVTLVGPSGCGKTTTLRLIAGLEKLTEGNIYFTDPRYGDQAGREMDVEAVYRLDPSGKVRRIISQPEIQKPNGIAVTPDRKTLYLVDSNPAAGVTSPPSG